MLDRLVLGTLHADRRGDYRALVPTLHDPDRHKYVAVAETDGLIAGHVAWQADPARHHGEITLLAADERHRGDGTGTALCEHAFADLCARGTERAVGER
ncbi:GNAT family N-acetyltransferase [Streptomyces sp. 11x1]|uniref:GNAT family N-acetyltransferase n=1 Tax=Streptomyces sp. 11x1 TaxID=3038642 RepID=UPI00292E1963|nr:GNAT family N-acetyltransferase [Streptomyces sp. 11x1]WNZ11246.1 GNAT family N-acetyltransferase [Streptomyces sp. 11x1]